MYNNCNINRPLPVTKKEIEQLGWDQVDVIIVSGDAYVDHPSFGMAVIGRTLEHIGLRVAIIPQPNWQDDLRDFKKLGRPRLFFGITSGCMDSMVNHYTANKRLRSNDAYTPGDKHGFRPDRATIVYSKILKQLFPDVPVVIGGIEASLRRVSHYDYWDDCLMPSILIDSNADMLIYGMGEKPIKEIATRLNNGERIEQMTDIYQTAFVANNKNALDNPKGWISQELFSHEECLKDKIKFAKNFVTLEVESNKKIQKRLIQQNCGKTIVINPAIMQLSQDEIDEVYALPYTRRPHFKYNNKGPIPAYEMIKDSINIHRGCFGGCSFCTISAHQGKFITSRSEKSVLDEIKQICSQPDFKGHITDIGGPSANMYKMQGKDLEICAKCQKPSCIFPNICKNLNADHTPINELFKKVEAIKDVKRITIGSGVRYDLLMGGTNGDEYAERLITKHVSGRLKVAPEHTEDKVLKLMRKPSFELFKRFKNIFTEINKKHNLNQQLIPYFISSHPGCEMSDMKALSEKIRQENVKPEQVQDFTPTPMTLSSTMFYTGLNPYTMEPVFVARKSDDKLKQKDFFFWYKKEKPSEAIRSQNKHTNPMNHPVHSQNRHNNPSNQPKSNTKFNPRPANHKKK